MNEYGIYVYNCRHCGRTFETHGDPHDTPLCPTCALLLRAARSIERLLQGASDLAFGAVRG